MSLIVASFLFSTSLMLILSTCHLGSLELI